MEILNEILQWIGIIYSIWTINLLRNIVESLLETLINKTNKNEKQNSLLRR